MIMHFCESAYFVCVCVLVCVCVNLSGPQVPGTLTICDICKCYYNVFQIDESEIQNASKRLHIIARPPPPPMDFLDPTLFAHLPCTSWVQL